MNIIFFWFPCKAARVWSLYYISKYENGLYKENFKFVEKSKHLKFTVSMIKYINFGERQFNR